MAAISDLVHETSATTGTGNLTVAAVNGKRTFNTAFGTGGTDLFNYYISNRDAAEWEWGTGHLSDATTLVRDTVVASSNAGSLVSFSAGTKDVASDQFAALQVSTTGTQTLTNKTLTSPVVNVGSDADGDIYYRSSGAFTRLAKGAASQKLVMNAGATAPQWLSAATTKQTFTSGTAATYTKPTGLVRAKITVIGGGGGGGGTVASSSGTSVAGGGGGGGGVAILWVEAANLGSTETYTVGGGGSGGTGGAAGSTGGTTTITITGGSTLTATGGAGGDFLAGTSANSNATGGAAGGVGSNGTLNISGSPGLSGVRNGDDAVGGHGGSTPYGGGGPGPRSVVNSGSNGVAGTGYGAGGSGASSQGTSSGTHNGAAGTGGLIIVEEFY